METLDLINSKVTTLDSLLNEEDGVFSQEDRLYIGYSLFMKWLRVPHSEVDPSITESVPKPSKRAILLLGRVSAGALGAVPARYFSYTSRQALLTQLYRAL